MPSRALSRLRGSADSVIAIYQTFETADEPIKLGLGTDGIWRRFWEAAGDPAYAHRPEFETNADRRKRRAKIVADIQRVLRRRSRKDWLNAFAAVRVPAGPIKSVADAAADPALHERGLFYTLRD